MGDYKEGKVYGLYYEDKLFYVGSTRQVLSKRLQDHYYDCKKEKNKNSNISKALNTYDHSLITIILIEDYPCERKEQLLAREAHHQRIYKEDIINQATAILNEEERKEAMKERVICECGMSVLKYTKLRHTRTKQHKEFLANPELFKEYTENQKLTPKERTAKYQVKYREENKERLLEDKKEYYINNKETIDTKKKERYINNKDTINEQRRTDRIECECGITLRRDSMRDHLNTETHRQNLINLQNLII